jgi:hypothetical protein
MPIEFSTEIMNTKLFSYKYRNDLGISETFIQILRVD